jgi:threonyl-tRNA synthetase
MLVVGDKEVQEGTVNVRKYGEQKSESVPLADFVEHIAKEAKK